MADEKNTGFEQFLKENLTWHDFEHLDELMDETPHMTTKIIANPARAEMRHIAAIHRGIKKCNAGITVVELMTRFGLGQTGLKKSERELIKLD